MQSVVVGRVFLYRVLGARSRQKIARFLTLAAFSLFARRRFGGRLLLSVISNEGQAATGKIKFLAAT